MTPPAGVADPAKRRHFRYNAFKSKHASSGTGSGDPDCKLWNGDCIYSWNIEKESESISGDRKTLIKVKNELLVAHRVNSNKNAL